MTYFIVFYYGSQVSQTEKITYSQSVFKCSKTRVSERGIDMKLGLNSLRIGNPNGNNSELVLLPLRLGANNHVSDGVGALPMYPGLTPDFACRHVSVMPTSPSDFLPEGHRPCPAPAQVRWGVTER